MAEKSLRSSRSSTIASTLPPYSDCNATPSYQPSCLPPSENVSAGPLSEKGTKRRSGSGPPPAPPDAVNMPWLGCCNRRQDHHSLLLHLRENIHKKVKSGSTKYHQWKCSVKKALQPCKKSLSRFLGIAGFWLLTPLLCWISPGEWFSVVYPAAYGCECIDFCIQT
ncbi:hypothetical protein P154DRAFT_518139 [Amniculicola lignicola CBS 123094]|uniref:Uncharacterized protein n=1 Tax=Amniculicola lignicola CBS 123094 TaxID=1392246 RepID=A0A6A5WVU8_9PLEO|nr:hypothetical protein P154DRAFT_518139 [Amniculicola lignicola CBS 123094]